MNHNSKNRFTANTTFVSSYISTNNCTVQHCKQCDPALESQCLECVPPYLRSDGKCRATCPKDFFPVHNMTDNPVDYPRCEKDCGALSVSGIPTGEGNYKNASSAVYNLPYQRLAPLNISGGAPHTLAYANLGKGAYLVWSDEQQWQFVGLSMCPNGTQQCSKLQKISVGGYADGPIVIRPQLCDQYNSCTWKMKQCGCQSEASPAPSCVCSRSDWKEVGISSLGIKCVKTPSPVQILPAPSPALTPTHYVWPAPSPHATPPQAALMVPLIISSIIVVVGIVVALITVSRRRKSKPYLMTDVAAQDHIHEHFADESMSNVPYNNQTLGERLLASPDESGTLPSEFGNEFAHVWAEWKIPMNRLNIDSCATIGSGGFGIVFKGKFDDIDVAVKKLDRSKFSSRMIREAAVLASLRHPHVVHLYGLSKDQFSIFIIMELCRISLAHLMNRDGVPPSCNLRLRIALQISDTMSYLHMKGVIHRDLKPENVLLHGTSYDVKICDFGLSKTLQDPQQLTRPGGTSHITLEVGTPAYMAPEMFVTDSIEPGPVQSRSVDGRKVDIYSYGILLFFLYTAKMPYKDLNTFQIVYRVKMKGYRPSLSHSTPECLRKLLNLCWHADPTQRPSFDEIHASLDQIKKDRLWINLGKTSKSNMHDSQLERSKISDTNNIACNGHEDDAASGSSMIISE